MKDIFLTRATTKVNQEKPVLLASNASYQTLLAVDDSVASNITTDANVEQSAMNSAIASCVAKNIPSADLYKNLKTPPGSALNEDVGRYIGY